jgi:hypothetical protein
MLCFGLMLLGFHFLIVQLGYIRVTFGKHSGALNPDSGRRYVRGGGGHDSNKVTTLCCSCLCSSSFRKTRICDCGGLLATPMTQSKQLLWPQLHMKRRSRFARLSPRVVLPQPTLFQKQMKLDARPVLTADLRACLLCLSRLSSGPPLCLYRFVYYAMSYEDN